MQSTCSTLVLIATVAGATGCTGPSSSYDFVLRNLVIDEDEGAPAAGFNFDGLYTAAGNATPPKLVDRVSDLDLDQNQAGCAPGNGCVGGVDNVLPTLVNVRDCTLVESGRQLLADALSNGRLVFLLRLTGVDSWIDDPQVVVTVFHGFSADADCQSLWTGSGNFVIDSSVGSGAAASASGAIVSGRLRVDFSAIGGILPPTLPDPGPVNLRLAATFNGTGTTAGAGNLGAQLSSDGLIGLNATVTHSRMRLPFEITVPLLADMPTLPSSNGDLSTADMSVPGPDSVGIGVRFELVRAVIAGSASAPPMGACGSGAFDDSPHDHTIEGQTTRCNLLFGIAN